MAPVVHAARAASCGPRRDRGQRAHLSGLAAEDIALRGYAARGAQVLTRRWRGRGGEIDLVLWDADTYVFCEVKKAASFDLALNRVRPGQIRRIFDSACEYLGRTPEGQLAPVRFDLALVDVAGDLRIVENAFGDF
ncbi:YraN family protein [Roseovarius sp. D22-M7]|uniref:YraN family protein n=1 Tax=Roseovarius sp. D22-M7 TaxID=3127116 RepID=UPI00300FF2EA